VVIGNIHRDDLAEMLESDYVRRWRTTVPESWKGCDRFPECFGGCRAASKQLGLSLADIDPTRPLERR